jgi:hypothetical protein
VILLVITYHTVKAETTLKMEPLDR